MTVKGKPGGTGVQICNGGCLKRKPRTPQKHGVIIGWCTSWGKAGTTAPPSPPPPLSSASVGPGRGTLLSRIAHTTNQGLLTSLGSRVLSAAHAKTSFRVSSGCPGLRRETPCSGRGQVVKCGGETASGERTAVGCVDTMEGRGMRGSAARMPSEEVRSAVEWHGRDSLQGRICREPGQKERSLFLEDQSQPFDHGGGDPGVF